MLDTLVGHVLTAVSECGSDPSLLDYFTWSNLKSARYLLSILHTVALSALQTRRAVFVLSAHFFSSAVFVAGIGGALLSSLMYPTPAYSRVAGRIAGRERQ